MALVLEDIPSISWEEHASLLDANEALESFQSLKIGVYDPRASSRDSISTALKRRQPVSICVYRDAKELVEVLSQDIVLPLNQREVNLLVLELDSSTSSIISFLNSTNIAEYRKPPILVILGTRKEATEQILRSSLHEAQIYIVSRPFNLNYLMRRMVQAGRFVDLINTHFDWISTPDYRNMQTHYFKYIPSLLAMKKRKNAFPINVSNKRDFLRDSARKSVRVQDAISILREKSDFLSDSRRIDIPVIKGARNGRRPRRAKDQNQSVSLSSIYRKAKPAKLGNLSAIGLEKPMLDSVKALVNEEAKIIFEKSNGTISNDALCSLLLKSSGLRKLITKASKGDFRKQGDRSDKIDRGSSIQFTLSPSIYDYVIGKILSKTFRRGAPQPEPISSPISSLFSWLVRPTIKAGHYDKTANHFMDRALETEKKGGADTEVIKFLSRAIGARKDDIPALALRAYYYARCGKFDAALEDSTSAITYVDQLDFADPDQCGLLFFNRGVLYTLLGNDTSALEDYRRAIEMNPRNSTYRYQRALLNRNRSNFREACDDYLQILQFDGLSPTAKRLQLLTLGLSDDWTDELNDPTDSLDFLETQTTTALTNSFKDSKTHLSGVSSISQSTFGHLNMIEERDKPQFLIENEGKRIRDVLRNSKFAPKTKSNCFIPGRIQRKEEKEMRRSFREKLLKSRQMKLEEGLRPKIHANGQLRDTTLKSIQELMDDQMLRRKIDLNGDGLVDLFEYKAILGQTEDVFDTIFSKPSILQRALTTNPGERSEAELRIIQRSLGEKFRLFNELDDASILKSVAQYIEYRVLEPDSNMFLEGDTVRAACFILSGTAVATFPRLESSSDVTITLKEGDNFGVFELVAACRMRRIPKFRTRMTTKSRAEILALMAEDFNDSILDHCEKLFKARFQTVSNSGIFGKFSRTQRVEICIHAQTLCYKRNDTIVPQGEPCDRLFVIDSGICGVKKYPDNTAQISRQLNKKRLEYEGLKAKYTFHHSTRKATQARLFDSYHLQPYHISNGEVYLHQLKCAIRQLEKASLFSDDQEANMPSHRPREILIGKLMTPRFFGESCLYNKDKNRALATVYAETEVTLFVLPRSFIPDSNINDEFLENVRRRQIYYPEDCEVVTQIQMEDYWKEAKSKVYQEIRSVIKPTV